MSLTYLTQGLLTLGLGKFCVIPKECVVGAHFSFVWTPAEAEFSCQNDLDTWPSLSPNLLGSPSSFLYVSLGSSEKGSSLLVWAVPATRPFPCQLSGPLSMAMSLTT